MAQTVLIVDDEPQLLRLLARIFEREGYEVLAAEDADQGIELFDRNADRIALLVLDVIIPPKGAVPVLEFVLPRRPELKLVLVSGEQLDDDLKDMLEARGGLFMRKPFPPKALLSQVKDMLAPGHSDGSDLAEGRDE
jgi:DNA-binding response OmpR family regulator